MSKPPSVEKLFLDGPAGRLEAILEAPSDGFVAGAAVVLHPHPQHGGTMHNKVAHMLARTCVRSGFAALRFNFRGTESSEGEYHLIVTAPENAYALSGYICDVFEFRVRENKLRLRGATPPEAPRICSLRPLLGTGVPALAVHVVYVVTHMFPH